MEYALHNGLRSAAQPKLKAICPHCGTEVQSKCGTKNIWHWAHLSTESCDPWQEPETAWHRDWKHCFGAEFSETRIQGEDRYHIADVRNKNGIVFEFQNSSISAEVIKTREAFYGEKMIWIINGRSFKDNFKIYEEAFIKTWKVTILDEFAAGNYPGIKNSLIAEDWQVKRQEVKDFLETSGFVHNGTEKIYTLDLEAQKHGNREQLIFKLYKELFHLYESQKRSEPVIKAEFTWENPRRSWQEAQRPVFIDLHEEFLFLITSGTGKKTGTGTKILRSKFLEKYT